MQFYKYEGVSVNENCCDENDDRKVMREKLRKTFRKTKEFNQHLRHKAFLFVIDESDDTVSIGVIIKQCDDVLKLISDYLKTVKIELKDTFLEEITFNSMRGFLACADRSGYINNDDSVLEQFDLDKFCGRYGIGLEYGENLLAECDKKNVYSEANKFLANDSLIPELDRIYAKTLPHKAYGHPVHYMVQTDDRETRKNMGRLLLSALYANNRLQSKRYCFVDFRPGDDFSRTAYDYLYKSCIGGTVVVRYMAGDDTEDNHASGSRETIEDLCEIMKKYRNQVLTVFCIPRECAKTKDIFYENLATVSIIELKEDFVSGDRAKNFLKMLAKENGIRTDKNLFAKLENDKGYLALEMHDLFDDWYNKKLKADVYPQYKDVTSISREIIKAAPKGSAYDELNNMIGLDKAKNVINQALNYYKAQKLFSDKGMKYDHPAMHMVFTGNPGTAKTSVARLFAKIMKENDLLSKGNLIEVGRCDLVGKFVGWTANIVKKKFEDAKGGVLFIDEAYSLVDDKDGSFGDEAINTIVQEMENHRDDVVVIFAGYPDKMESFLKKNPGLRSRIAYHIPFNDYDTDSLCKIANLIAGQKGLKLTEEAKDKLTHIFDLARTQSDFGNGRYVRNIIEKAKMAQATRLLEMDFDAIGKTEIVTLCAEDIEMPPSAKKSEKNIIGFCA